MIVIDKQKHHAINERWDWREVSSNFDLIIAAVLVIVSIVGFVALTIILWRFTADDAFITLRYADNVAKGWGLTFNQVPPRAEGYTSILWTLIMIFPHLIGVDAVLFSKYTGVGLVIITACTLAYGILIMPQAGSIKNRILGAAFASVLFLTFPYASIHAVSGMETSLATFLYTMTALLFLNSQENDTSTPLLPLSCLLLGLTRPEANLFSLILLGILLFSLPGNYRWKFVTWSLIFYFLPGMVYFVWRYHYYGMFLPLPFYVKSTGVDLAGFEPTLSFVVDLAIGFLFPLYVFITSASIKKILILLPIVCLFGYFITIDHIMGYGHRYFFPLVPVLSLLAGLGLSMKFQSGAGVPMKIAFLLCALLALAMGFVTTMRSKQSYLSYAQGMETAHILLGRTLAAIPWSSDATIAIGDAGAVPYYSGLETVDTFGLNDPVIARNFHGDRSIYVLSKNPTVIILISKYDNHFDSPFLYENTLYKSCMSDGFTSHVTFIFREQYYLWVLWRPHSNDAYILNNVLMKASQQSYEINK